MTGLIGGAIVELKDFRTTHRVINGIEAIETHERPGLGRLISMEVILLIVGIAFGLIPALLARRTGRNFWLWWLYGFAVWPVAMIHVVAAKPPEQGGTGTLGKALATILGIPIGGFTLLFIIFLSIPEETRDRMVGEPVNVTQERTNSSNRKTAAQSEKTQSEHKQPKQPDDELPPDMCGMDEPQRRALWELWVRAEMRATEIAESTAVADGTYNEKISSAGLFDDYTRIKKELHRALLEQNGLTQKQFDSISIESVVRAWSFPKREVAAQKTEQEPEPTFDPSAVIGQLQKPQFCMAAANVQWQRHDLWDGTERWLGSPPHDELQFEITPDWLYVMGSIANTESTTNALLAFYELNSIAMPDNYEKVNNEILPGMIDEAALAADTKQSREFSGWLLELTGHQVLVSISYKISRLPEN